MAILRWSAISTAICTGKAVRAKPVVADGILLVQNVEGELTAFRLQ
jgi:hypothetical protein